jgi:hypothetical protein
MGIMINLKSFSTFLLEATNLTPGELKKTATGGPNAGLPRLDILSDIVKKQDPLELIKGGTVVVTNTQEVLASIEQFKKDGKSFSFEGDNGKTYSTSDLKKSKAFGGGAGAGGGTKQTAIGEAAQCLWIAATLGEGYDKPIDYFTDKLLSKYFKKISVGKTSLDEILDIDDGWKISSHLTAQFVVSNNIVDNDMVFHRDDSVMNSIYNAKNVAFKNNDFKPLTDDKWNPGDIWAVEKGFSLSELNTSTVESFNDDILDLYLQKRLIGISLKKVRRGAQAVEKNVERPPQTQDYKFTGGHIKALKRGEWYTTKANYITFEGGQVDLRANSAFGSHKSEIKGKGARGGGASWGVMQDASSRIYGKSKQLPKNSFLKKESEAIANGDKKAISKFTKMLQVYDRSISELAVIKELKNKKKDTAVWVHGKLGGLYVLDLIQRGGKKANQFITQLVNYAGSSTSDSSAYVILKEK